MTLYHETLSGKLASMWSVMVEQVICIGTSINCLRANIVQISEYFLMSLGIEWLWSKLLIWKMYDISLSFESSL